ncbi:MAG: type IV-A pilus assembly ATPase PilB [Deltaproteobacteria bacterium]
MGGSQSDILEKFLKRGVLSPEALKNLRASGKKRGISPLEAGLLSGTFSPDAKSLILAESLGLPFQEVDPDAVSMSLSELVSESVAREHRVVPLSRDAGHLTLAVADPFRNRIYSEIERVTGLAVRLVVSPPSTIGRILDRLYPDMQAPSAAELEGGYVAREEALDWISRGKAKMLVERILLRAAGEGFSSVRVYPSGRHVRVSGRKAGRSTLLLALAGRHRRSLVEALADLSGIAPDPTGLSEASFHLESASGAIPFTLLLVRGLSGPEAVVRVLPDFRPAATLDSVGLTADQVEVTRRMLEKREGLYLLSAPGPEGAATTLFAMLREVAPPGGRIVTVEDRFRFRTERFIQLERKDVEARYGGSFSRLVGLLEPDALMVETLPGPAGIEELVHVARNRIAVLCGVRGAGFGDTIRILMELPVDPYRLSRAVRLLVHQRLVDLLCPACRRPVPAKPDLPRGEGPRRDRLVEIIREHSFFMPAGCERCEGRGFSGKMALAEVLPFTHGVQNLFLEGLSIEETVDRLFEEHFYPADPSIRELLRRGMITYDDIVPFFR